MKEWGSVWVRYWTRLMWWKIERGKRKSRDTPGSRAEGREEEVETRNKAPWPKGPSVLSGASLPRCCWNSGSVLGWSIHILVPAQTTLWSCSQPHWWHLTAVNGKQKFVVFGIKHGHGTGLLQLGTGGERQTQQRPVKMLAPFSVGRGPWWKARFPTICVAVLSLPRLSMLWGRQWGYSISRQAAMASPPFEAEACSCQETPWTKNWLKDNADTEESRLWDTERDMLGLGRWLSG